MSENLMVSTGAASIVPDEANSFQQSAYWAIGNASDALDAMYALRPNVPDAAANPGTAVGNIQYQPPGSIPQWDFTFTPPVWNIVAPVLGAVTKTPVVDDTGSAPAQMTPKIPLAPSVAPVPAPGAAPTVSDVVIPAPPPLTALEDPEQWAITIPTVPVIDIPTFLPQKPVNSITVPSPSFNWQEDPYTSETLDDIIANVAMFSAGGVGIPNEVWEAIWTKENDKENRSATKLVDEINTEWSKRGFQIPQGIQMSQVMEVRQQIQSSASGRARDIAIKEADLAIENLRFAVQQGIALETLRGSWYQSTQQRMLEATRFASELTISLFNAEVSFYNAQVQMYLADAQVYKIQVEAALADLEIYKSELEAQKLIGDLNEQQVQIYIAKVQALNLEIDRYNAMLDGIKTSVEVDKTRIDAYGVEVQAYGERIKAISVEYDAYSTAMDGAKTEAEIYDVNVKAYSATIQAYATKVDAEAKNTAIDIDINKYKLDAYNTDIQAYISQLDSKVKELTAESTEFNSKIKSYDSGVISAKASTAAQTADYNAKIALAGQTTQANITNAQANSQNAIAEAQIVQKGLESIANVNGAYAGSAMSAINLSMGIKDTATNTATFNP